MSRLSLSWNWSNDAIWDETLAFASSRVLQRMKNSQRHYFKSVRDKSFQKKIILCTTTFLFVFFSGTAQVEQARKWIDSLTAPDFHGRGYVQGGDSIAAEFLARRFREFGALPYKKDYFQRFHFQVNTFPGKMDVAINGSALKPGEDYVTDPVSGGGKGEWKIFEVSLGNLSQFAAILKSEKGKHYCYVFDLGVMKDQDSLAAFQELMMFTAEVAPVIKLQEEKFMWSVATDFALKQPFILLKREVYFGLSADVNTLTLNIDQKLNKHQTQNVIGYISGKNKKALPVVFTAHYDHLGRMGNETLFPGANDNASGVAMLLALMEHYAKNQPERTVVFMAFAAEEAGISGSKYYVENPLFPLKKIHFLINMDLAGTGDDGITVVNGTEFKEEFLLLTRINQENEYLKEVKVRGKAANSDHYWFTQKGVPCFFIYTLGGVSHYHDIYDVAETLPLTKFNAYHRLLLDFVKALN